MILANEIIAWSNNKEFLGDTKVLLYEDGKYNPEETWESVKKYLIENI